MIPAIWAIFSNNAILGLTRCGPDLLVQCIIDLVIAYLLSLVGVNKTVEIGAA